MTEDKRNNLETSLKDESRPSIKTEPAAWQNAADHKGKYEVLQGMAKKINRDTCPVPNSFWRGVLKRIIIGLAIFVVALLIFGAGMSIGGMKARFSYRWAESYHKNFGGPRGGFLDDWQKLPSPASDFIEGHGTFGKIIKIELPTLVIDGQRTTEKIILLKEDTAITRLRDTIKSGDLKVDDYIVVIGSPNEAGQIEAKLIRVMLAPPDAALLPGTPNAPGAKPSSL